MTDFTDLYTLTALLLPQDERILTGSTVDGVLSAWLNAHQPLNRQLYLRKQGADLFSAGCFELLAQGRYQALCDLLAPVASGLHARPLLAAIYGWSLHHLVNRLAADAFWQSLAQRGEQLATGLQLHVLIYQIIEAERRQTLDVIRPMVAEILQRNQAQDSWIEAEAWYGMVTVLAIEKGFQLDTLQALTRSAGHFALAGLLSGELLVRNTLVQFLWQSGRLHEGLDQIHVIEGLAVGLDATDWADYLLVQGCIYYELDQEVSGEASFARWQALMGTSRREANHVRLQMLISNRLYQRRLPEAKALIDQLQSQAITRQETEVQAMLQQGVMMRWQVLNAVAWQDEAELVRLRQILMAEVMRFGRSYQRLSLTLVLIQLQDFAAANEQLEAIATSLRERQSHLLLLRVLALQAGVSERLGQPDLARRQLASALRLVAETGAVRGLIDEYFGTRGLLMSLLSQQALAPEICERLQQLGSQTLLSERESEILQWLEAGLSNPEIASRLFVSINTVKFHLKNIYQKLGVSNRAQALKAARTQNYPAG